MSWLVNYVRPRIQQLVRRTPSEDELWRQCPECAQMLFLRDLEASEMVCPHCSHHLRIGATGRFNLLFDNQAFEALKMPETPTDPLKFRDSRRYTDRLKDAHAKNGPGDALKAAVGQISGAPAVVAVLDFSFMGGSMGAAVGAGFVHAVKIAVEREASFVAVTASGGARMQEGILSLMQMPRTVAALSLLRDARLPYIAILTDPTTGGVSASFAMLGDVAIAEPGAGIGFAGQRVIKETIGQTLPDGFQRAEYLHAHGMIDMVCARSELKATLGRVLSILTVDQAEPAAAEQPEVAATSADADAVVDADVETPVEAAADADANVEAGAVVETKPDAKS